ncbi:hypothetical protein [Burkholderia ubonensis]|nr:hypothetical protein [Burkholderia ubonensis]
MDDLRSFYEREPAFLRHHAREFIQSPAEMKGKVFARMDTLPAVDLTEQ